MIPVFKILNSLFSHTASALLSRIIGALGILHRVHGSNFFGPYGISGISSPLRHGNSQQNPGTQPKLPLKIGHHFLPPKGSDPSARLPTESIFRGKIGILWSISFPVTGCGLAKNFHLTLVFPVVETTSKTLQKAAKTSSQRSKTKHGQQIRHDPNKSGTVPTQCPETVEKMCTER